MKTRKEYLLALISLIIFGNSHAQNNDAQLWTSFNLEKKLTKTIALGLSEELRFNENFCELGTFFTDIGLSYKIRKGLSVSGNYRFTNKRELNDSYSKRHRYYFDASYRKKIKIFSVGFRTRFQSQYSDVFCSDDGKIPEYYSRNKLSVKFDLDKKYTPYVSTELFYQLNNSVGNNIDNMRYTVGIEYDFNKKSSLDLFYMIQQEYSVTDPERDFVIGIGYNVKL